MPRLTNFEKDRILELSAKGYSSREIAREIFGDKDFRKSTINDFLYNRKKEELFTVVKKIPNIACLDIETAASSSYFFGKRYDINVSQDQIISESYILSYSVKFLGDDNIIFGVLEPEEAIDENDFRLVSELYELLNEIPIFIAHNGKGFDFKVINTRLVYHGFTPPSPYKVIDTLLIARRVFAFPSNKLDSLCIYLGLESKTETGGFKLWKKAMNGDEESLNILSNYNINDVIILENLYYKLRPWDSTHPNINLYKEEKEDGCPCCGSNYLTEIEKKSYTNISTYPTFRCNNCGKIMKRRKKIKGNDINFIGVPL